MAENQKMYITVIGPNPIQSNPMQSMDESNPWTSLLQLLCTTQRNPVQRLRDAIEHFSYAHCVDIALGLMR